MLCAGVDGGQYAASLSRIGTGDLQRHRLSVAAAMLNFLKETWGTVTFVRCGTFKVPPTPALTSRGHLKPMPRERWGIVQVCLKAGVNTHASSVPSYFSLCSRGYNVMLLMLAQGPRIKARISGNGWLYACRSLRLDLGSR